MTVTAFLTWPQAGTGLIANRTSPDRYAEFLNANDFYPATQLGVPFKPVPGVNVANGVH